MAVIIQNKIKNLIQCEKHQIATIEGPCDCPRDLFSTTPRHTILMPIVASVKYFY